MMTLMSVGLLQSRSCHWVFVCSEEAWRLSPLNGDNVRALRHKYPDVQVAVFCAEFDSPAFSQQARAYFEVWWLTIFVYSGAQWLSG